MSNSRKYTVPSSVPPQNLVAPDLTQRAENDYRSTLTVISHAGTLEPTERKQLELQLATGDFLLFATIITLALGLGQLLIPTLNFQTGYFLLLNMVLAGCFAITHRYFDVTEGRYSLSKAMLIAVGLWFLNTLALGLLGQAGWVTLSCFAGAFFLNALLSGAVRYELSRPYHGKGTLNFYYQVECALKRGLDVLVCGLGIAAISPLLVVIALAIKLDSPGPILYKSRRIGYGFHPFDMYKFRSMRTDADDLRDRLREQANLKGELFKMQDDPRITKIGKFIRAYSLDELPQLLNVLRGEMSLVGPRPLPPDESELFEAPYTVRFGVIPGITGAWQVSGRSNLRFHELCRLDHDYVKGWAFLEDIKILLRTVPVVLLGKGAC